MSYRAKTWIRNNHALNMHDILGHIPNCKTMMLQNPYLNHTVKIKMSSPTPVIFTSLVRCILTG